MAQHDYVIDNQSAPLSRADINSALQAIVTQNSGASAPATTYANMFWYDTVTNQIKKRNEANSAWITLGTFDETTGKFDPNASFTAVQQGGPLNTGSNKIYLGYRTDNSGIIAQVDSGVYLGRMVTTTQLTAGSAASTQINAPGDMPLYACRAWVNFNGQGAVAIRGSGNVSSITDNGTGQYTVNFATAMPDVSYAPVTMFYSLATNVYPYMPVQVDFSTGSYSFATITASTGLFDPQFISCSVFR